MISIRITIWQVYGREGKISVFLSSFMDSCKFTQYEDFINIPYISDAKQHLSIWRVIIIKNALKLWLF
jgi:hypothetical protein